MHIQGTDHMFNFRYVKSSKDIIIKAMDKVTALESKVEERKKRIVKTREEYEVTDAMMIDLLQQAREQLVSNRTSQQQTYSVTKHGSDKAMSEETVVIGAGVVNMLFTEQGFIEAEKKEINRLQLIIRNLDDIPDENGKSRGHNLGEDELRYLGF